MSERETASDEDVSRNTVTGVPMALAVAGALTAPGTPVEMPILSVVGVLSFVTVSGVIVVSDVLANTAETSDSGVDPIMTSEPTNVAGIVLVVAAVMAVTFVFGLRVLAMLGLMTMLAVGGVLVLFWILDPRPAGQ